MSSAICHALDRRHARLRGHDDDIDSSDADVRGRSVDFYHGFIIQQTPHLPPHLASGLQLLRVKPVYIIACSRTPRSPPPGPNLVIAGQGIIPSKRPESGSVTLLVTLRTPSPAWFAALSGGVRVTCTLRHCDWGDWSCRWHLRKARGTLRMDSVSSLIPSLCDRRLPP